MVAQAASSGRRILPVGHAGRLRLPVVGPYGAAPEAERGDACDEYADPHSPLLAFALPPDMNSPMGTSNSARYPEMTKTSLLASTALWLCRIWKTCPGAICRAASSALPRLMDAD